MSPLFLGGGQEFGRRAGTENTPMIVGLGVAAEQASGDWLEGDEHHFRQMRDLLKERLEVQVPS